MTTELEAKVNKALDIIRPFLHEDGGDVELLEIDKDNVVKVRLVGACSTCDMSKMTLKAGIEDTILTNVPEITRVDEVVAADSRR